MLEPGWLDADIRAARREIAGWNDSYLLSYFCIGKMPPEQYDAELRRLKLGE